MEQKREGEKKKGGYLRVMRVSPSFGGAVRDENLLCPSGHTVIERVVYLEPTARQDETHESVANTAFGILSSFLGLVNLRMKILIPNRLSRTTLQSSVASAQSHIQNIKCKPNSLI